MFLRSLKPFRVLSSASPAVRQYSLITANYWAFTLTDGALRMLVVLFFHQLGYSPLQIAMLFLFYEFFGVVTNLIGGWLGAKWGLNRTMNIGLALQIIALAMLLVSPSWLTVAWVMAAQALSGIAKDLNKMSAKSSIKLLLADDKQSQLYRWVALLTGSKNTLKGCGFFLGGGLLSVFGFQTAVLILAVGLLLVWIISLLKLQADLGKANHKPKFSQIFAKSAAINYLSAARLFLFAARDVWFVVALPVYLASQFTWSHWLVGGFIAAWIVLYGLVQTQAPRITGCISARVGDEQHAHNAKAAAHGKTVCAWGLLLSIVPAFIAASLAFAWLNAQLAILVGLLLFAVLFALNSSLHSYLIVSLADRDGVSMDVGFYYMANAAGRLLGTILSGWVFQQYGLVACLLVSSVFLLLAAVLALRVPTPS